MTPQELMTKLDELEGRATRGEAIDMDGKVMVQTDNHEDYPDGVMCVARGLTFADARLYAALRNAYPALRAYVRGLEEVVGKLPKTADGVPIVPGMQLWDENGYYAGHPTGVMWTDTGKNQRTSRLYSTLKAAKSARAATDAGGGGA